MERKYAYICSPYKDTGNSSVKDHVKFAQKACRFVYNKGYIPIAPHLYFTQFMNDDDLIEREDGLILGMEILKKCDKVFVFPYEDKYLPNGISLGMQNEINLAISLGIYVEVSSLNNIGFDIGKEC